MVPCGIPIQDSIDDQLKATIYSVKGFTEVCNNLNRTLSAVCGINESLFVALRRTISV